jgi:tRNA pseudouridine38-40 synthase
VPTYRLKIEYLGSGFAGWQIQPGQRTVQGVLTEALATVLREPVSLQGASRTDAGVHALGQAASFETDVQIEPGRLVRGLSALARPDAAVIEAALAPDGFNARFDSIGKRYRYRVLNRSAPSPLHGAACWHVPQPIDRALMRRAAASLVGTHDFAGFRAADCGRPTTERELTRVEMSTRGDALLEIAVEGTAFLKNMVRIIAGTLVDIGLGKLEPGVVDEVLTTGDRGRAGQTAPAHGLTLVEVLFPDGWLRERRSAR